MLRGGVYVDEQESSRRALMHHSAYVRQLFYLLTAGVTSPDRDVIALHATRPPCTIITHQHATVYVAFVLKFFAPSSRHVTTTTNTRLTASFPVQPR